MLSFAGGLQAANVTTATGTKWNLQVSVGLSGLLEPPGLKLPDHLPIVEHLVLLNGGPRGWSWSWVAYQGHVGLTAKLA